ncbi:MAG TPA: hypothetical protein VGP61_04500 [Gemmatimonadales bacterium]|jgi:hypothetical protein|nr:hypothetical protein [Gemmatimonadales bacterium]
MSLAPEALLRRLAIVLGLVVLINVIIEAVLSLVVGNPIQPPFSTPQTRFQLVTAVIPRLVEIVGGLGLLVAGYWNGEKQATERTLGWSFVLGAGLLLLPLILLVTAFRAPHAQMPPAGLLRFQVQFVRGLVFYLTVSGVLLAWGRLLLANSKAPRGMLTAA